MVCPQNGTGVLKGLLQQSGPIFSIAAVCLPLGAYLVLIACSLASLQCRDGGRQRLLAPSVCEAKGERVSRRVSCILLRAACEASSSPSSIQELPNKAFPYKVYRTPYPNKVYRTPYPNKVYRTPYPNKACLIISQ